MQDNYDVDVSALRSVNAVQRNHLTTSEAYRFIDTNLVLEQLADSGWRPTAANESKTRKPERAGFQKHAIKLSHPEFSQMLPGIAKPSMLLRHSHDGSSSLQLLTALDVFLCANGIVRSSGDLGEVRILHRGYTENKLRQAVAEFLRRAPEMVTQVKEWHEVELAREEQLALTQAAIELRFDPITNVYGEPTNNYPVTPQQVFQPRRSAEAAPTLWNTFNVIQENLIDKGGIRTRNAQNRRVTTRAVKSVDANTKLNQALWALTAKMADIKLNRSAHA